MNRSAAEVPMNRPNKVWDMRRQSMRKEIDALPRRSPVVDVLGVQDLGSELRTVLLFKTETLVQARDGAVQRKGPVVVGLRYNERFLAEAPNPSEIVSILAPFFVFHPN